MQRRLQVTDKFVCKNLLLLMMVMMIMVVLVMMMVILQINILRPKQCSSDVPALKSNADVGAASVDRGRGLGPLAFTHYHPTTTTTMTMMNVWW